MGPRAALKLLAKAIPFYILILVAWQLLKVSHIYHHLIAWGLDWLYPALDPLGPVKGVGAGGGDLLVKLLISGKKLVLVIKAEDITSNTAMLLALYLASPIRPRLKRFFAFFIPSLFVLYLVHLGTAAASIKYAFLSNPTVTSLYPPSTFVARFIPLYKVFYTNVLMYLSILALWLPYIGFLMAEAARSRNPE
jgi:hypothetical protein